MIRSLNTGVSGLLAQQTSLDVVSDNISNSSTTGFKRSRTVFSDQLGQELLGVSRSQGGETVNPAFVGNGTQVNSIDKNFTQGALEETNVRTDLAIDGDGFFLADSDGRNVLTRAGNLTFNDDGFLSTAGGLRVQGFGVDADGNIDATSLQDIQLDPTEQIEPEATTLAEVTGNISADASEEEEVTVSTEFFDQQGDTHTLTATFEKQDGENDEWELTIDGPDDVLDLDEDDFPVDVEFNSDGSIRSIEQIDGDVAEEEPFEVELELEDNEDTLTVNLDDLNQFGGSTTAQIRNEDGFGPGDLVDFAFDTEGRLIKNFSNGEQAFAGQLALGDVRNPQGLEQLGDNLFGQTPTSGDLNIGRAGQEINAAIQAGQLEQSNVDLATEFTDMIEAQRGYQANSRTITTSDEVLQETVGLVR